MRSFTASKILTLSGINDGDVLFAAPSVGSLFLKAKRNSDDEQRTIEAYGDIVISSLVVRNNHSFITDDGYVMNCKSKCKQDTFAFCDDFRIINESRDINIRFDIPDEIEDVIQADVMTGTVYLRNSKLYVKVHLNALTKNKSGDYSYLSTSSEFEYEAGNYSEYNGNIKVNSFDIPSEISGTADIKINISFNLMLYNYNENKVLSDIECDGEETENPSVTVYFAKENEAIWDIAKRFTSDMDLITGENDINGERLNSDKILIIPGSKEVKYEQ